MGLDTVELVMDVEVHFGVLLREERRWRVRTIGDLADAILDELSIVSSKPCPTMRAFYELRGKIRSSLSIPDLRIRPSTRLSDLIPISHRRVCWEEIQSVQPWHFPGLKLSLGAHLKTKEMVLNELFPIVSKQFGVDIKRLTVQSRFVEDLGAD